MRWLVMRKPFVLRMIIAALFYSAEVAAQEAQPAYTQLQVQAATVLVRAAPARSAEALAEVARGNLLNVLEQRGDWYRVALPSQLSGWIQNVPAEYGQMALFIFPAVQAARFLADTAAGGVESVRPGHVPLLLTLPPIDSAQVAPPQADLPRETQAVADRWRLMQALGYKFPLYDPYNQNPLKGDMPVLKSLGNELFFELGVVSETNFEARRLPTPVAAQVAIRAGANDIFGAGQQTALAQNLTLSFALIKGDTTFRPPDFEFRFVPVFNFNHASVQEAGALNIDPGKGTTRNDQFAAVQELFADFHLRNVSERFDFDSMRIGIQPFNADFRGFLFQDAPFGIRVFGNRHNNEFQYNLAWFRRIEKDTNSGLNDLGKGLRHDDVFVANLYRQDWPMLGFTSQFSVIHNRNRETEFAYDSNGFLVRPAAVGDVRPHQYQVTYLGYNGDGHFGRWNLTASAYAALGTDEHNPIAQKAQQIRAGFFAAELSRDIDWLRVRGNVLLATGDKDPNDNKATGFDAILENPKFAGADSTFFVRQALPLIGGGGVAIAGRNSLLPSLRSSADEGQSNFVNPGLAMVGLGIDADVLPQLRLFSNVSYLRFMETSVLSLLRNQAMPSAVIGTDLSFGFHWRPYFTQNLIVNGSASVLQPGAGLRAWYVDGHGSFYSVALNMVLTF